MTNLESALFVGAVFGITLLGLFIDWRRIQRNHRQARELRAQAAVRRAEKACQRP